MKRSLIISMLFGLTTILSADANIPIDKNAMKAKVAKIAGETSIFNKNENFPKDYFLIPKNLPFALGIVLHHPQSSTIGLSKSQIEKLVQIKMARKPLILKKAKEIKNLELKLVDLVETDEGKKDDITKEMSKLVDKIAQEKAELTKQHIKCIIEVQNILTNEQKKKVEKYINKK